MVDETAAAVEFDGTIAARNLEMKSRRAIFHSCSFRKVEKLGGNSLSAMSGFNEEFVHPGAFAVVLQAEIETDDEIRDRNLLIACDEYDAVKGILQKLQQISSNDRLVGWLVP